MQLAHFNTQNYLQVSKEQTFYPNYDPFEHSTQATSVSHPFRVDSQIQNRNHFMTLGTYEIRLCEPFIKGESGELDSRLAAHPLQNKVKPYKKKTGNTFRRTETALKKEDK